MPCWKVLFQILHYQLDKVFEKTLQTTSKMLKADDRNLSKGESLQIKFN
jgi:hypothetical protein